MNTPPDKAITYCAILTTFNAQKMIKGAVNAILEQSIKAREIIIVDDMSTDETVSILEDSFSHIPNLKIFTNKSNSGQSHSRNLAAEFSTSDLLIFFDDDDISHSERASEHIRMFEIGADINFVSSIKKYSNSYEVLCENEDRNLVKLDAVSLLRRLALGEQDTALGQVWIPASTSAIGRSLFQSLGGFDTGMRRLEDAELIVRAAISGCCGAWSSKVMVVRASTQSDSKGGTLETDYEKKFVMKFQELLTKTELNRAMKLIEIRRAYFSRNRARLILLSLISPSLLIGPEGRLHAFLKRVLHDKRQRK